MRKGFMLIELLAVIVILAVIALIATPMILGVIEQAKESSAESSALGYIDAVEKTISINMLDSTKEDILDGVYEIKDLSKYQVQVKGEIPSSDSWLKIENKEIVDYSFKIGEYVVSYNLENNNRVVTKDGEIKEKSSETIDTHKGIVYLDPTDLTKTCTKEMAESNLNENGTPTGIKTGCMKWYIYDDTGDNYKLLLDHNAIEIIKWNKSNKNVAYESSNLYSVVEDLKTTSGWVVEPRLITVEEVNVITEKTGFNSSDGLSWYYLDSKDHTQTAKKIGASKYTWVYDYLYDCESYGCNINDNNNYIATGTSSSDRASGYWTSTPDGNAGNGANVWYIAKNGNLTYSNANSSFIGIRPVITIQKSIIK